MHYANMPVQYTAIFHGCKNVHFQMTFFNIFLIFAQNIDYGYVHVRTASVRRFKRVLTINVLNKNKKKKKKNITLFHMQIIILQP